MAYAKSREGFEEAYVQINAFGLPIMKGNHMFRPQFARKYSEDTGFRRTQQGKPLTRFLRMVETFGLIIGIMAAATFISLMFRNLGFHESNYIMTYNLGVVLIAYLTEGYWYGIAASLLGMLTFNYFFTVPYYTLVAYSPEYPVTFIIMLITALIASTLTARAKRESQRAETREKRIHILYQLEKNLLAANSKPQLIKVASKDISGLFDASVMILVSDLDGELSMRHVVGTDIFQEEREKAAMMETYRSGMASGTRKELFSFCSAYYLPVNGPSGVLGVIGIAFPDKYMLLESQKMFLDTISAQIALALERERLYEKQQRTKMEIEKERLRGNLLRSVSHDLRTPLTSILGSVGTMIENYDVLDDAVCKDFLSDIYGEAEWLSALVENILSLTRLEGGKIALHKEMEAVEEIVAEAVSRVKKRAGQHVIDIAIPTELLMIPMDGTLIEQVLVNLLDNAIKHTPAHAAIRIAVRREKGRAVFEVSDNGQGIPDNDLPFIFDRYFTKPPGGTNRRGIGIGLSICDSIVKAHGGEIAAENKSSGGAVFRFTLPTEENE